MMEWSKYFYEESNILMWKINTSTKRLAGKQAGWIVNRQSTKYIAVSLHGKVYYAHRILYELRTGEEIKEFHVIDHIDGDGLNNSPENLRVVTQGGNNRNMRKMRTNKSGVTGVHWNKQIRKWVAQIWVEGKVKHIGTYSTIELARVARKEHEERYGYHKMHGKDKARA